MGKIILCESQQAVVPYIFVNTKVEVYSYEELCFYIYNNIALLNEEQFHTRLVNFIETELGMEKLAQELKLKLSKNAKLVEILVTILSAGQYYDSKEVTQFVEKQELLALLPTEERIKLEADSFLLYKRYLKALSLYDDILRKADQIKDIVFLGDVYHNKAVALAKNMELTKAKLCFLEAYSRNKKKESLESYVMLRLLEEAKDPTGRDIVWKEIAGFQMTEADFNRLSMLVEDSYDDSKSTSIYTRYEKALYNREHGDMEAFNQRVDMLLNQWKEEFREQVV